MFISKNVEYHRFDRKLYTESQVFLDPMFKKTLVLIEYSRTPITQTPGLILQTYPKLWV